MIRILELFQNGWVLLGRVWLLSLLVLAGCQFQPLYSQSVPVLAGTGMSLSSVMVSEVSTRQAQQVRNHLIFLLSNGSTPANPTHDVKLRVSSTVQTLAGQIADITNTQLGNTAGSVQMTASYDVYDTATKEVVFRGSRTASASFDKTSQNFASSRATRDAENRAAMEVAEQLRLAIAAGLAKS
jgi:LPS-assembly lipoprotein